jgi:hypothetical protein
VERFTRFGIREGGPLSLPTAGQIGPMAAWPRNGSTFVTYLDNSSVAAGLDASRQWLEITCPSTAPDAGTPDAGTD